MPRDERGTMLVLAGSFGLALLCVAGAARGETFAGCAGGAMAIPDDGGALVVPIDVVGTGTVTGVTVDLEIAHPWVGDLVVTLTDGSTSVVLMSRVSLGTYPFGCGGDDVDATFSDDATVTPADLCSPTVVPNIAGPVLPEEALGAFAGTPVDSAWALEVRDEGAFDGGTLDGVCLTITATVPPPECTADLDGDLDVDVFDFAIFASSFGQAVTPGTNGDYDSSGVVDVFDFGVFAAQFGCAAP